MFHHKSKCTAVTTSVNTTLPRAAQSSSSTSCFGGLGGGGAGGEGTVAFPLFAEVGVELDADGDGVALVSLAVGGEGGGEGG